MPSKALTISLALVAATGFAETKSKAKSGTKPAPAAEKSIYDSIWNSLTLYKDKDSSLLNEFKIVGRAHFDEYYTDSNLGWDQDWIVRRAGGAVRAGVWRDAG